MQQAWIDVERPGGSHTALDGKKIDRPLAEARALVDSPAAFTREMTRILREKQGHPLIAQMMKPAESSDPPPTTAAGRSSGSRDEPYTGQSVQFQ